MYKLRASFSLLNTWASGNYEQATKSYFRLEQFTTQAMADGKKFHEDWHDETKKTGNLPLVFGGAKLVHPEIEKTIIVTLEDWLDLKSVIDCLDGSVIHEYKSGARPSESYANSHQAGVYAVACLFDKIQVNKAIYHHYDQHKNLVDNSTVWITKKVLDDSQEWIYTYASEIHNYFTENDLYKKFEGRRNDR